MTIQTNRDPAYIAANPEAYGFAWTYRDLNKGKDQKTVLRTNAPHVVVSEDAFATFLENFPKAVMSAINGTSTVIRGQNVTRTFLKHNPRATNDAIQTHIVNSVLLNAIVRLGSGSRTVYIGADGKEYATREAAQQAAATLPPTQSDTELAAEFMAEAIDAGIPLDAARKLATKRWPKAFEPTPTDEDEDEDEQN